MRQSDIRGVMGQGWIVPLDRSREWYRKHPERGMNMKVFDTTLCQWFVNANGYHPFWSWWMIGVVHLRPVEGMPDPNLSYPLAECELSIISINPEGGEPSVDGEGAPQLLMPPDVIFQFHGLTDDQAHEVAITVVEAICAGAMSPDSDHRRQWMEILNSITSDYRAGKFG